MRCGIECSMYIWRCNYSFFTQIQQYLLSHYPMPCLAGVYPILCQGKSCNTKGTIYFAVSFRKSLHGVMDIYHLPSGTLLLCQHPICIFIQRSSITFIPALLFI